jgi:hypothetical protein
MRIADECRDPDLLAAEVRRLRAVISAGEPTLTADERKAILTAADLLIGSKPGAILRNLLERLQ